MPTTTPTHGGQNIDPTTGLAFDEMRPCPDPVCIESEHPYLDGHQDGECETARIKHPQGYYYVSANRYPGHPWAAWVSLPDEVPAGQRGLDILRQLVHDFEKVHAECERLNSL